MVRSGKGGREAGRTPWAGWEKCQSFQFARGRRRDRRCRTREAIRLALLCCRRVLLLLGRKEGKRRRKGTSSWATGREVKGTRIGMAKQ